MTCNNGFAIAPSGCLWSAQACLRFPARLKRQQAAAFQGSYPGALLSIRLLQPSSTPNPDEPWMLQVTRNACDAEDGFLREKKYLLMDRDTKFSEAFRVILEESGVTAVRLPPRSPNLSPNLERFMRSIKEECLERIIFFGEKSMQNAVADFLAHYHQERNHQGLNNQLIQPGNEVGCSTGDVACRERLRGMLRYYYRQQAA